MSEVTRDEPRRWVRVITPTLVGMVVVTVMFAALVWHRRWIADDGMIVVRTVRELLAGNGPVYNVFERTEPNTSTLWTYLLALVGWATREDLSYLAVALGGLCSVVGVGVAMDAARRWHRARGIGAVLAPAGVLIVLGVSAFWTFATSGLETGLGLLWLALAWWLLVTLRAGDDRRRAVVTAVVLGLGPLVRPDFGIVMIVFLPAAWLIVRPRARRTVALAGAALALPLAYEIFRAGYYGTLVPLPALAKSAGSASWGRGLAYLENFVCAYVLWLPFAALAAVLAVALVRRAIAGRDRVVLAAPIVAAALMAAYVVRVGGDFMHARMLLPAAFTAVMPAMLLPVRSRTTPALIVLVGWALVVGIRRDERSRVTAPGIQDEWTGYRSWTHNRNPIDPSLFIKADGPAAQMIADAMRDGRRRLISEAADLDLPMNPAFDAPGVYAVGRLGTGGAVMPLDGIVADTLGLANPVGARLMKVDGIPGHEKSLPRAWLFAEFGHPGFDTTVFQVPMRVVEAARHAMDCGELAELLASVRAPMTPGRFWDNLIGAARRTSLAIPTDPFEAEAKFCGVVSRLDDRR
jgi:arabinofuranosyltransferase